MPLQPSYTGEHRISLRGLRRGLRGAACLALAVYAGSGFAQGIHPFDGVWSLNLDAPGRPGIQGTVEVKGDGGSWATIAADNRDSCTGRTAPIIVRSATPDELIFAVMRSKVLAGCPDFRVSLKPVSETVLEGALVNGWKVRLTRK